MKQCLFLYFFICCCCCSENFREIDFSVNPFRTNFSSETFISGGDKAWVWSGSLKKIFSGDIERSNEESWLDFTFLGDKDGFIEISFYLYSPNNKAILSISLNGIVFKTYANTKKDVVTIPFSKGRHTLRFSFKKNGHSGEAMISNIRYGSLVVDKKSDWSSKNGDGVANSSRMINISTEISHSDKKSDWSSGNGDGIANPFEMLHVAVLLTSKQPTKNISFQLLVPQNVYVILREKYTTTIDKPMQLDFSLITNGLFHEKEIKIKLVLKSNSNPIATIEHGIPFAWLDPAHLFLQQEKVLASEKFDYASEEELDAFLQKFPESELAPVLFTLRLECCRRVRDKIRELNNTVVDEEEKEKNLITAINS